MSSQADGPTDADETWTCSNCDRSIAEIETAPFQVQEGDCIVTEKIHRPKGFDSVSKVYAIRHKPEDVESDD